MIAIPRGLARSFRAVLRKGQTARPRPPAPPVHVEVRDNHLRLSCALDCVSVMLSVSTAESVNERVLVPMAVLDAAEGAAVEITVSARKGTARWESRDGPKTMAFKLDDAAEHTASLVVPEEMHSVAPSFLAALHECGRTAARESSRYAIHRVQVNGKDGSVAATDGKLALVQRGVTLPFRDAVLIPALPVFGMKELASETDVHVGRGKDRLFVRSGSWTISLAIDIDGRFPDVAGVIPKSPAPTVIQVDDRDANELLTQLPEWPDTSDGTNVVKLDVNEGIVARSGTKETGEEREYRLSRSTSTGPAVRVGLDRRHIARALALGFRTFRLAPDNP